MRLNGNPETPNHNSDQHFNETIRPGTGTDERFAVAKVNNYAAFSMV